MSIRKRAQELMRRTSYENVQVRTLLFELADMCEDLAYEVERLQSRLPTAPPSNVVEIPIVGEVGETGRVTFFKD